MRMKKTCIALAFLIIMSVGAFLFTSYLEQTYTAKDPKQGISTTYPFASAVQTLSCPEYRISEEKSQNYTKVRQKSMYNGSKYHEYNQTVVIVTPISNAGNDLENYFRLLCSLSYPHHLISVVMGEDSSKDKSLEVAKMYSKKLGGSFRRIDVHRLPEDLKGKPRNTRHDEDWQLKRRAHLAKSRNRVLSLGLQDEDWVLWLDADVQHAPPDIIQHLMSCEADVCVASCLFNTKSGWRNYDLNSWQETNASHAFLNKKPPEYLMLEGYRSTKRRILPSIQDEGLVVDLDSVGGCALLVKRGGLP